MKSFIVIILFLFAINNISNAQNPVMDKYPGSTIFAIDYSTGQEVPATIDDAILFKDALIDLVSSIPFTKSAKLVAGHKSFVITQMDPQTNGNAYRVILQSKIFKQSNIIYTFVYNVDQNTLSYFDVQAQSYAPVQIVGYNLNNLNNCAAYGRFNIQNTQVALDANNTQPGTDPSTEAVADSITANIAPPELQDEVQPECPTEGYLWQPGNWSYNPSNGGYYWVPGAWVAPPTIGFLWTPPYWGFERGFYILHPGYWGNTVGFYGGVNYGYGYAGEGFGGGEWRDGHFRYNTAVMRVNGRFQYRYEDRSKIYRGPRNRVAYNGGRGGIDRRPNELERREMDRHRETVRTERMNARSRTGVNPGPRGVNPGPRGVNPGPRGVNPGPRGVNPGPRGVNQNPRGVKPGPKAPVAKPRTPAPRSVKPPKKS